MKMEVFEKVGEIEIVSLRPACENNMIAEAERKRKEEEERIRREEVKRKNAVLTNGVIAKLAEAINARAEKGHTCLYLEWRDGEKYDTDNYTTITWDDFTDTLEYTRPLLESAGYEIHDFHVYSEGWRRRNGKLGYIYLFW